MEYLCAKFCDFSFSRFGFIVRTDRQNHRGGWSTTVGVSNYVLAFVAFACILSYSVMINK